MDDSATQWAGCASAPEIARISTAHLPVRDRASLLTDELGPRLSSGRAVGLEQAPRPPSLDWLNVDLGAGLVLADVSIAGLDVAKSAAMARVGDEDCSLFVALTDGIRSEQNDRRQTLSRGDGLFIAHSRAVRTLHVDERFVVVRLPRSAVPSSVSIESAGGLRVDAAGEAMTLLRHYLAALMQRCEDGRSPSAMARRHVAELASTAIAAQLGRDDVAVTPQARSAARLESMLAYLAGHYAVPGLSMREVAATVGISARSGYSVFAAGGVDFTEHLTALRLDRAYELLEVAGATRPLVIDVARAVGFTDLSHFNRRFRQRYGCTPRELRSVPPPGAASAQHGARVP